MIVATPEYVQFAFLLQLLVITFFLDIISLSTSNILLSYGQTKKIFQITLLILFLTGILNILFLPIFGLIGIIISRTLTNIIVLIVSLRMLSKFEVKINMTQITKNILPGILVLLATMPVFFYLLKTFSSVHIIVQIILFCFLSGIGYVLMLFKTKIITIEMIKQIIIKKDIGVMLD